VAQGASAIESESLAGNVANPEVIAEVLVNADLVNWDRPKQVYEDAAYQAG
jgi:hypothetical protein